MGNLGCGYRFDTGAIVRTNLGPSLANIGQTLVGIVTIGPK
jgi:hypothetical protein